MGGSEAQPWETRENGYLPQFSRARVRAGQFPQIDAHCLPSASVVEFWEVLRTTCKPQVRKVRRWEEDLSRVLLFVPTWGQVGPVTSQSC